MADVIPLPVRELRASLQPASRQQVAEAVTVLVGSFKVGGGLEHPQTFIRGMNEALGDYPADVLEEMIQRARRKFKFLPSIAEVFEICEELVEDRRRRLGDLDRMAKEQWRQEEAGRQAERQRQDRERTVELEARLVEMFGDDAPRPGDLELAARLRPTLHRGERLVSWRTSLLQGEPRAATLCRRLALVARAKRAEQNGHIGHERVVTIAHLAIVDEVSARQQVEDIEAGKLEACPPPRGLAANPRELEAAITAIEKAAIAPTGDFREVQIDREERPAE